MIYYNYKYYSNYYIHKYKSINLFKKEQTSKFFDRFQKEVQHTLEIFADSSGKLVNNSNGNK